MTYITRGGILGIYSSVQKCQWRLLFICVPAHSCSMVWYSAFTWSSQILWEGGLGWEALLQCCQDFLSKETHSIGIGNPLLVEDGETKIQNKNNFTFSRSRPTKNGCCIFWPAFGCCTPQTLVEIVIFSIFCKKAEKHKKVTNLQQNLAKKLFFFKVCTKTPVKCFIPEKIAFLGKNTWLAFGC